MYTIGTQGRKPRGKFRCDATSAMVGRIYPPGGDRVKVSENLGATAVVPVAPVDTSLLGDIHSEVALKF